MVTILDVTQSFICYLSIYNYTIVSHLPQWNIAVDNCMWLSWGCLSILVCSRKPCSIMCGSFMPINECESKTQSPDLKNIFNTFITTTYIFIAYITFSHSVIVCLQSRISQSWFCCMICCFSSLPTPPIQIQRLFELIPLIKGDGAQKHFKHAGGPPHNYWSGIKFSNGIRYEIFNFSKWLSNWEGSRDNFWWSRQMFVNNNQKKPIKTLKLLKITYFILEKTYK